jgi:hypothetical protein
MAALFVWLPYWRAIRMTENHFHPRQTVSQFVIFNETVVLVMKLQFSFHLEQYSPVFLSTEVISTDIQINSGISSKMDCAREMRSS